jgi:hypothetical protein
MFRDSGVITEEYGRRLAVWANSGAVVKHPVPEVHQPSPNHPTTAAQPPDPASKQPPYHDHNERCRGKVESVVFHDGTFKTGPNIGKPFTRCGIAIGGVLYGTYSTVIGQNAKENEGKEVEYTWDYYGALREIQSCVRMVETSAPAATPTVLSPNLPDNGVAIQEDLPF